MSFDNELVKAVDKPLLEEVGARLDLRDPNIRAIETLAVELAQQQEGTPGEPFEGVIDSATGVGKTYILAGSIEYFAARGVRNFAVITPGRTILEKTVANFTKGHPKSLLDGMDVQPVVITADNFNTPAMRAEMDDPSKVKLYIFTVQSLTRPTSKSGRKTHKFQEGLGEAFYDHLTACEDLIVFADEHHTYYGDAFSSAVRGLSPLAIVGLTATPHAKTPEDQIIFRYPLAAAIADKLVKTPVIVGRKDDRKDAKTKLLDGVRLLEAKQRSVGHYVEETGDDPINPVMLVICPSIDVAEEVSEAIDTDAFLDGRYKGTVLTVHSKKPDEELAKLEAVEDPDSPVRIIVSVGMLKEGWDVKNVYVILSFRPSISDILTEQTLGRGLRLPFGRYTEWELLDTLEVIAHERYQDLLKKSNIINEAFIDFRTRAVTRRDAEGNEVTVLKQEPVAAKDVSVATVEDRQEEAEKQADAKELKPVGKFPVISLPDLRMTRVESKFSFADITDLAPFKDLGERLADDPEQELRRTVLDAVIIEGADGIRHTELVPGQPIDKIAAPAVLIPLAQAKKALTDRVRASSVGGARKGAQAQLQPIIDALIKGMGDDAEEILSGYGERTAARLIQLIGDEQRKFAPKPHFDKVVELREFGPVRLGKAETTRDRTGAFKKVGYEGWKKSYYSQVWFDSSTERDAALILDSSDEISYWARLHINDLPIVWEEGSYNPDFIAVAQDAAHWVIEVKSDKEMKTGEVQAKRQAAQRWANYVTADSKVKKTKTKWRYLLVSETDIKEAKGDWKALKNLAA
jgi:type III restriction enzyme